MQRTLLICRHAETFDPYPLQSDFERELTPQGHQQAIKTGKWLRENFLKLDALLASPARRANSTARIIASRLYFDEEKISYDPDLYNAKESQLLRCLSELPEHVKTVLLVGHNPGITRLAREVSCSNLTYLEPASVVAIQVELDSWQDIYATSGTLASRNQVQAQ